MVWIFVLCLLACALSGVIGYRHSAIVLMERIRRLEREADDARRMAALNRQWAIAEEKARGVVVARNVDLIAALSSSERARKALRTTLIERDRKEGTTA